MEVDTGPSDVHLFDWRSDASQVTSADRRSHGSHASECSSGASTETILSEVAIQQKREASRKEHNPLFSVARSMDRMSVSGRLTDIRIGIYRSSSSDNICIYVTAKCHGKSISNPGRVNAGGWRERPVELARKLLREFIRSIRSAIEATAIQYNLTHHKERDMAIDMNFDKCNIEVDHMNSDGGSSYAEISELADGHSVGRAHGTPAVCVVNIEWGSCMRWGGDCEYDPEIDGDIILQGGCTTVCRAKNVPAWEAFYKPRDDIECRWYDTTRQNIMLAVGQFCTSYDTVAVNEWILDNGPDIGKYRVGGDECLVSDIEVVTFMARYAQVRIYGNL